MLKYCVCDTVGGLCIFPVSGLDSTWLFPKCGLAMSRCECIDNVTTAYVWLQDLAAASQEQVNDVWAGLGYYRRARLLLEGAQHVQANLSGKIPVNSVELQKIPGVPSNCQILQDQ